jgi:hypothetical protein
MTTNPALFVPWNDRPMMTDAHADVLERLRAGGHQLGGVAVDALDCTLAEDLVCMGLATRVSFGRYHVAPAYPWPVGD